MGFLKKKNFWLTLAHLAVAGVGVGGAILFPPLAPIILSSQALANGIIPSPIVSKTTSIQTQKGQ